MMRVIHTSRSPFELAVLAALLLIGAVGLALPRGSSRAVEVLPLWGQYVWYGGLTAGCLLGLTGALTSRLWSLYAERGALLMLTVLLVAFASAIMIVAGLVVAFSSAITLALAAACIARARQITTDIRRIMEESGR